MSNNIAFTGAAGTGKSTLATFTEKLLQSESVVMITPDLDKHIMSSIDGKYRDYFSTSEELGLSTSFLRRIEALRADPNSFIVTDSWALNDLASLTVDMNALQQKIELSNQIIGPDGNPLMTQDFGQMIILQAVFQVLINQVAYEQDFWDFIYYCPIYTPEDGMIDEEAIPPNQRLHQKEVDIAINALVAQLGLSVVRLPVSRKESFEFLEGEYRKWTK